MHLDCNVIIFVVKNQNYELYLIILDFECINTVCDTSNHLEGISWGYYTLKDGDCRLCKKYCLVDNSCESVECGASYCRWWTKGNCNNSMKLVPSNVDHLQTCLKHATGILIS